MEQLNVENYRKNILDFCQHHGINFEENGTVGLGRACIGLSRNGNYVNYNPRYGTTQNYIEELFDERLNKIVPELAHPNYKCFAVLGRGVDSLQQLSGWIDDLKKLNVIITEYQTHSDGVQFLFRGAKGLTVKILR